MQKIKKTAHINSFVKKNLKLLTGKPITIGKEYNKITVLSSSFANEVNKTSVLLPFTALAYRDNRLILADAARKYFVFLVGDMAESAGTIIAEDILTVIKFNQPITEETTIAELRNKYHFVPPHLLELAIASVQTA